MDTHLDNYPPGFAAYIQPLLNARRRLFKAMPSEHRILCLAVIDSFRSLHRAPTLKELIQNTYLSTQEATRAIERLDSQDVLVVNSDRSKIVALYPFVDIPGQHYVHIEGLGRFYAM